MAPVRTTSPEVIAGASSLILVKDTSERSGVRMTCAKPSSIAKSPCLYTLETNTPCSTDPETLIVSVATFALGCSGVTSGTETRGIVSQ